MNPYLVELKSKAIQLKKSPKNMRLLNNLLSSFGSLKKIEDSFFLETYYGLLNPDFLKLPISCEKLINGNFFPESCEKMGDEDELPFTGDFRLELRWWFAAFQLCTKEINYFVRVREQYDTYILLNKYEEALALLEEVQKKLGVSFWLYESMFFVYSKLEKDNACILDSLSEGLNGSIIRFFGIKTMDTVTYSEYKKMVEKIIEAHEDDQQFYQYLRYRLLPMEYSYDDVKDFLDIMMYSEKASLVDKYILFMDMAESIIGLEKLAECKEMLDEYIGWLSDIQDERLEAIRFCLDRPENRLQYQLKSRLLTAKELFVSGEYDMAREEAIALLLGNPYCIQAIDIVAEVNSILKDQKRYFENTLLQEILDTLEAVYITKTGWRQDALKLTKLLSCCSKSGWAGYIYGIIHARLGAISDPFCVESKRRGTLQYLDLETVCECLPYSEKVDFLSHFQINSDYVLLREMLLCQDYTQAEALSKGRDFLRLVQIVNPHRSLAEKKVLMLSSRNRNALETYISKCYMEVLLQNAPYEEVIHYVTEVVVENMDAALYAPWEWCVERIQEADFDIRRDICVPILYYVRYKSGVQDSKDDVIMMCEDFLFLQGVDIPSRMEVCNSEKYPKETLIFFLRYVCAPEILSSALASVVNNSMDLWKERIDICQILCTLDEKNEKVYEEEIRTLTQKRKIYSELRIIEENRIHVNVEAIRTSLMEELEGEYARYKLYSSNRWKDFFAAFDARESLVKWNSEPERVLQNLILKIRDAFVSSTEHGLDFTLSLSIRHGAIEDELRRPLAKAGLSVIHNEKEKQYQWDYKLPSGLEQSEVDIIKSGVIQLNVETKQIIEDLKKKYIQVRTETNHEEGIFDFRIREYEFEQFMNIAENTSELREFIDAVIDYLWIKTEISMQEMKKLIKKEIMDRYKEAYDKLKNILDGLEHKNVVMNLRRRVVDASNEMQNVTEKVCYWFQRSTESKNQDFDLDFVFQMGFETIQNMHPETKFRKVEIEPFKTDGNKIPGKNLKAYSDIFYNLFDNIYKKAKTVNKVKCIEYCLEQQKETQRIYLRNPYDCKKNIEKDRNALTELQRILDSEEYLNHIAGEGGTGIPKICKIIRKDLCRSGVIQVGLLEEDDQFFIDIKM